MTEDPKKTKKEASTTKGKAAPKAKDAPPSATAKKDVVSDYRLPASHKWAVLWKIFAGLGALGLVGAGAGYATDPTRFAFSWLFGFTVPMTIAMGAIFFVLLQHLSSAGWSVTVRRVAEFLGAGSAALVVLVIPIALMASTLYSGWMNMDAHHGAEGAEHAKQEHSRADGPRPAMTVAQNEGRTDVRADAVDMAEHKAPTSGVKALHGKLGDPEEVVEGETMHKKTWWLNKSFFYGRLAAYPLIWLAVGLWLLRTSASQDSSKDLAVTRHLAGRSAPALILIAFSMTFAVFDWIMALEPTWYSTIFGVTFFGGSMVAGLAVLILIFSSMRKSGLLVREVNVEHYHDLGKLLFGFLCFWAYVSFSQFMLIWYAAVPEELTFFHHRWDSGPWKTISLAIVVLHFVVPFVGIMSRNIKRRLDLLGAGTILILAMHVVELYWLVMPNVPGTFAFHWMDLACLVACLGVYLAVVFYLMTIYPLIPVGDPRLERALKFENA